MSPETILDVAIDNDLSKPSNFLSGETVLKKELGKPVNLDGSITTLNLKPIDLGKTGIEEVITGKIAEVAASVVNSIVNNYSNQSTVNGGPTFKEKNLFSSNQLSPSTVLNGEAVSNSSNTNSSNLQQIYNAISSIEPVLEKQAKLSDLVVSQIPMISPKEILETSSKTTNSTNTTSNQIDLAKVLKEILTTERIENSVNESNSTVRSISNFLSDAQRFDKNIKSTEDVTSVKSSKLAESNLIKSAISPDQTLVTQVENLTKVLPDTINNLTSAVSSINQQNLSNSSVTNEGSKIDQSTNTTINQADQTVQKPEREEVVKNKESEISNDNFYLQGIYQALISGKIKVRLDYQ